MMLLVDLDNTLLDRASAFDSWAADFIRSIGRPSSEAAWLIEADRNGYEPRESLARALKVRCGLHETIEVLVDRLLYEHVELLTIEASATQALAKARTGGWKIAIVSNGTTVQQLLKIHKVGLEQYVDAVVISEAERVKKPDPEIFRIAAHRLGQGLSSGWMIGDHPTADIAGGLAAGLETGWVSQGETWSEEAFSPTIVARTVAEAINAVVLHGARDR